MLHRDSEFFRYVMFSDETTFHNGQLNRLSLLMPTMRKLEKDNGLEVLQTFVLFSYKKLISNCWYYLSI